MADPVDFESSLLNNMRHLVRGETPAETPATPESSDVPAPDAPVEAAPSTEVVPAEESTSPVEAAPAEVTAAAESPSTVEPAPASDVPQTSARDTLSKRGLQFGDEKTAAEYLRVESELAARVRAEKQAKQAQPVEATQPEPQPTAPEPTPVVTAPVVLAPVVPDQTAPGRVELPVEVLQKVEQHVREDSTCRVLATQYTQLETERTQICKFEDGLPISGKIFDLNTKINTLSQLKTLLGPANNLKEVGIDLPGLDDLTLTQLKDVERDLKDQRRDAIEAYQDVERRQQNISRQYQSRREYYQSGYEQDVLAARAEADRNAKIESETVAFATAWPVAEEAAFKAHNVPDDLRAEIHEELKIAGLAHLGKIEPSTLSAFMNERVEAAMKKFDKYHRLQAKQYAVAKIADAKAPAPSGPAAIAPPALSKDANWDDALQSKYRAARASRSA